MINKIKEYAREIAEHKYAYECAIDRADEMGALYHDIKIDTMYNALEHFTGVMFRIKRDENYNYAPIYIFQDVARQYEPIKIDLTKGGE